MSHESHATNLIGSSGSWTVEFDVNTLFKRFGIICWPPLPSSLLNELFMDKRQWWLIITCTFSNSSYNTTNSSLAKLVGFLHVYLLICCGYSSSSTLIAKFVGDFALACKLVQQIVQCIGLCAEGFLSNISNWSWRLVALYVGRLTEYAMEYPQFARLAEQLISHIVTKDDISWSINSNQTLSPSLTMPLDPQVGKYQRGDPSLPKPLSQHECTLNIYHYPARMCKG